MRRLTKDRDAIEALLSARDAEGALAYVGRLENYARAEPLSWADLFAARGRALCAWLRKGAGEPVRDELARVRTALGVAGMTAFLPAIDVAMAT